MYTYVLMIPFDDINLLFTIFLSYSFSYVQYWFLITILITILVILVLIIILFTAIPPTWFFYDYELNIFSSTTLSSVGMASSTCSKKLFQQHMAWWPTSPP